MPEPPLACVVVVGAEVLTVVAAEVLTVVAGLVVAAVVTAVVALEPPVLDLGWHSSMLQLD